MDQSDFGMRSKAGYKKKMFYVDFNCVSGLQGVWLFGFRPAERECRVSGSEREHVGELDLYPAVEIDVLAVLQVQHYQPDQNIRK